jgi:putative DNA methylase
MPIYQIHKWWGRRLGGVFRAILISSFLDSKYDSKFWDCYYNGFLLNEKVVYDPFMGGGTTIVEALRLGCKVVGCDINPVAWFVTKKEIDPFDEKKANTYFNNLNETVGKKIQKLYKTECLQGHSATVKYCLWIRQIRCKRCHEKKSLFNNFVIRDTNIERVIVCPVCFDVLTTKSRKETLRCKRKHTIHLNSYPGMVNASIHFKKS